MPEIAGDLFSEETLRINWDSLEQPQKKLRFPRGVLSSHMIQGRAHIVGGWNKTFSNRVDAIDSAKEIWKPNAPWQWNMIRLKCLDPKKPLPNP